MFSQNICRSSIAIIVLFSLFCICLSSKATIKGKILAPKHSLQKGIQVILNGNQYSVYARNDGGFTFYDLPSGTYYLEVISNDYLFQPIVVTITQKGNKKSVINGAERISVSSDPLILKPREEIEYYEPEKGFDYWSMLKSPMVIGIILTGVMGFLMPKLVDKEALQEVQQTMQEQQSGGGNQGQGDNANEGGITGMLTSFQRQMEEQQRQMAGN